MVVQCCVCKKTKESGRWVASARATSDTARVSHGYCPDCFSQALTAITDSVAHDRKGLYAVAANQ